MKTFDFKSSVCTSIEQSKRLLELGLKKETADMCWQKTTLNGELITYPAQDVWHCSTAITDYHIPAWSLHRLMEIAMKGDKLGCITHNIHQNNVSTYYELVIASIEHLIKIDEFNKDYLEEKL